MNGKQLAWCLTFGGGMALRDDLLRAQADEIRDAMIYWGAYAAAIGMTRDEVFGVAFATGELPVTLVSPAVAPAMHGVH